MLVTHLRGGGHHTERTEGIVQETLVYVFVQIADEKVGAYVELFLVRRGLQIRPA